MTILLYMIGAFGIAGVAIMTLSKLIEAVAIYAGIRRHATT